jgi:hypothetical protein
MIRAIHSPSKFSLVMTMMPRCRKWTVPWRIRPCQNAWMPRPPERSASWIRSSPSTCQRQVALNRRRSGVARAEIAATWARFFHDNCQTGAAAA